jgi:hypothetical protein
LNQVNLIGRLRDLRPVPRRRHEQDSKPPCGIAGIIGSDAEAMSAAAFMPARRSSVSALVAASHRTSESRYVTSRSNRRSNGAPPVSQPTHPTHERGLKEQKNSQVDFVRIHNRFHS